MKKKFAVILSAALVFLLAACNSALKDEIEYILTEYEDMYTDFETEQAETEEITEISPSETDLPDEETEDYLPVEEIEDDFPEEETKQDELPVTYEVGEIIEFGEFDWRVLDVHSDRMLIITENIVEISEYHRSWDDDITWADSEMRAWLNNEVYYYDFNESDRARIIEVTNKNPDNPWYSTKGGIDTNDRLFLLSIDEVVKYFGDSGQLSNRPNNDTMYIDDEYNRNRMADEVIGSPPRAIAREWWLRSSGLDERAAMVRCDGRIWVFGLFQLHGSVGVRPAMWVSLE